MKIPVIAALGIGKSYKFPAQRTKSNVLRDRPDCRPVESLALVAPVRAGQVEPLLHIAGCWIRPTRDSLDKIGVTRYDGASDLLYLSGVRGAIGLHPIIPPPAARVFSALENIVLPTLANACASRCPDPVHGPCWTEGRYRQPLPHHRPAALRLWKHNGSLLPCVGQCAAPAAGGMNHGQPCYPTPDQVFAALMTLVLSHGAICVIATITLTGRGRMVSSQNNPLCRV